MHRVASRFRQPLLETQTQRPQSMVPSTFGQAK
jgi:hypothetical protein